MARHRADEIIDAWETVAQRAVRPAAAPRPRVTRSALPGGVLAAGAAIVVLLVALSVRAIGPAAQASGPATRATAGNSLSPSAVAPSPRFVFGLDGIPTQLGGQPVHTMLDQSSWPTNSDSFLLAAQPSINILACPPGANLASPPYTAVEAKFLTGLCDYASLRPIVAPVGADRHWLAPKSPAFQQLYVWSSGEVPLVMRVHTHDPEAAQCTAARLAQCEEAIVVEAILWPLIPSELDGEHVYSGDEINSLAAAGNIANLKGSILLGGVVWRQDRGTIGCSPPPSPSAQDELVANCVPTITIGGASVAPKSSLPAVTGQLVIVRGHVNDPLAAQCPTDLRTACESAFVVESMVWSEGPFPRSPTPTPTPVIALASAGQTPSPADAAAARNAVDQYTAALVRGDYATAYAMLAPESQPQWPSLSDFIYERSAFFKSVAGRYTIQVWPTDIMPLTSWLDDRNRSLIDQQHAVLVEVDYPALAGNNAGWEVCLVSPVGNQLEIFEVR